MSEAKAKRLPDVLPKPGEQWTRDDAIAVMCRSLARMLEFWGHDADAQAVLYAEHVLRRPALVDVTGAGALHELQIENERLRQENEELKARREEGAG